MRKCFCNENFKWDGSSLNCTQEYGNLAKTPKPANQKPLLSYLAIVVGIPIAVALVALVCIIGYMTYLCKKAITNRKENRTTPAVHLYDSERGAKHLIDSEQFREEDKKGIDVSFFHLEDILAATNNFLDANKLEQGGFGPIYKGKFPEAQEIVVKRLSRASGQGPKEFKNEVLIAKLQHQNMFRLLAIVLKEIRRSYSMNICPTKT